MFPSITGVSCLTVLSDSDTTSCILYILYEQSALDINRKSSLIEEKMEFPGGSLLIQDSGGRKLQMISTVLHCAMPLCTVRVPSIAFLFAFLVTAVPSIRRLLSRCLQKKEPHLPFPVKTYGVWTPPPVDINALILASKEGLLGIGSYSSSVFQATLGATWKSWNGQKDGGWMGDGWGMGQGYRKVTVKPFENYGSNRN